MIEEIIKLICKGQGVTFESLLEETRKGEIVYARQLIMYFASVKELGTLSKVGEIFGKDHATVLHAKKTIDNYLEVDKVKRKQIIDYANKIDLIERIFDIKDQVSKLLDPLKAEISEIEQRIISTNLTVEMMKDKIDNLIN